MLNGTDLMSAYQPFDAVDVFNTGNYASFNSNTDDEYNEKIYKNKQELQKQTSQEQSKSQIQQEQQKKQIQQLQELLKSQQQKNSYNQSPTVYSPLIPSYPQSIPSIPVYNQSQPPIYPQKQYIDYQLSYFEKLCNKKKDLGKLIQFTLIIVLGLSIHYLIDYYLTNYISNNDFSFERKLILRLLYPFTILFILWNLKVFVK